MRIIRQIGIDSAYLVVGFPLGLVGFILPFALFAVGVGLVPLVVGVPIVIVALYVARGFADLERLRLPAVLRRRVVRPRYRRPKPSTTGWRRLLVPLRDGQSWLDLLHACLYWIPATVGFSFTITWWAVALGGLSYPLWDWALPRNEDNVDLNELIGLSDSTGTRIGLYVAIGVAFLLTLPLVTRFFALLQAHLSRGLLVGLAEMRDQIEDLDERRSAAVDAEAVSRRQLERDLHDGPQQRLVRLAMDLSRTKRQLDTDPAAARTSLDEAMEQAKQSLAELRALSRGIAPPVLTDRGLPGALTALAGRSTVPVQLDLDPSLGRLPAATENTAYYVVAESLTNVAKHSGASGAVVAVRLVGDTLQVTIVDDGTGGAHVAKGQGLSGLADRVRAAGGMFVVSSPDGGPTGVEAVLPCG